MPYIPTMPKNRIFPALVFALLFSMAAWAQNPAAPPATNPNAVPPDAAPAEPPTDAEVQLDAAIKQISLLKSVFGHGRDGGHFLKG